MIKTKVNFCVSLSRYIKNVKDLIHLQLQLLRFVIVNKKTNIPPFSMVCTGAHHPEPSYELYP